MGKFEPDYDNYFKDTIMETDDFLSFYDHIDIVDFKYSKDTRQFYYPCPCGDLFIISLDDLRNGETVARCPSCSLIVFVEYEEKDLLKYKEF